VLKSAQSRVNLRLKKTQVFFKKEETITEDYSVI